MENRKTVESTKPECRPMLTSRLPWGSSLEKWPKRECWSIPEGCCPWGANPGRRGQTDGDRWAVHRVQGSHRRIRHPAGKVEGGSAQDGPGFYAASRGYPRRFLRRRTGNPTDVRPDGLRSGQWKEVTAAN